MALARARGARVAYSDPFVPKLLAKQWAGEEDLESQPLTAATLGSYDCVAILTDHSSLDYAAITSASQVVVDTRNAIKGRYPHVLRLGSPHTSAEKVEPPAPLLVSA